MADQAVAYVRVSTLGQEENGKNLEGQLARIKDYCAKKGYVLPDENVFRDIVSGTRTDREGFFRLLARIQKPGVNVVVAFDVSRYGRNSLDAAMLMLNAKENRVRVETVNEGVDFTKDTVQEFLFDTLSAASKFIRSLLLSTMTRGRNDARCRGGWTNGAPMGYRIVGRRGHRVLEPDQDAELIRRIFKMYAEGQSLRQIAYQLTSEGATAARKKTKRWCAVTVSAVLSNGTYRGFMPYQGQLLEAKHTPLIDAELWERVQFRIREQRRRFPGRPKRR